MVSEINGFGGAQPSNNSHFKLSKPSIEVCDSLEVYVKELDHLYEGMKDIQENGGQNDMENQCSKMEELLRKMQEFANSQIREPWGQALEQMSTECNTMMKSIVGISNRAADDQMRTDAARGAMHHLGFFIHDFKHNFEHWKTTGANWSNL